MSPFYFGNVFVNFHSDFTIFERIIPDNYYLQVLSLLTSGTSLKLEADDASMQHCAAAHYARNIVAKLICETSQLIGSSDL